VPDLAPAVVEWLAVGAGAVAVVALALAVVAHLRLRRLRRAAERFWRAAGSEDVAAVVDREIAAVARLRADVGELSARTATLGGSVAAAVRHVCVVRFDAFEGSGGRQSFSAALLDEGGDGLVLTSINGRAESRVYAKGVRAGAGQQPLSPEEEQAIEVALRGAPVGRA
jgi:hypothetical protein